MYILVPRNCGAALVLHARRTYPERHAKVCTTAALDPQRMVPVVMDPENESTVAPRKRLKLKTSQRINTPAPTLRTDEHSTKPAPSGKNAQRLSSQAQAARSLLPSGRSSPSSPRPTQSEELKNSLPQNSQDSSSVPFSSAKSSSSSSTSTESVKLHETLPQHSNGSPPQTPPSASPQTRSTARQVAAESPPLEASPLVSQTDIPNRGLATQSIPVLLSPEASSLPSEPLTRTKRPIPRSSPDSLNPRVSSVSNHGTEGSTTLIIHPNPPTLEASVQGSSADVTPAPLPAALISPASTLQSRFQSQAPLPKPSVSTTTHIDAMKNERQASTAPSPSHTAPASTSQSRFPSQASLTEPSVISDSHMNRTVTRQFSPTSPSFSTSSTLSSSPSSSSSESLFVVSPPMSLSVRPQEASVARPGGYRSNERSRRPGAVALQLISNHKLDAHMTKGVDDSNTATLSQRDRMIGLNEVDESAGVSSNMTQWTTSEGTSISEPAQHLHSVVAPKSGAMQTQGSGPLRSSAIRRRGSKKVETMKPLNFPSLLHGRQKHVETGKAARFTAKLEGKPELQGDVSLLRSRGGYFVRGGLAELVRPQGFSPLIEKLGLDENYEETNTQVSYRYQVSPSGTLVDVTKAKKEEPAFPHVRRPVVQEAAMLGGKEGSSKQQQIGQLRSAQLGKQSIARSVEASTSTPAHLLDDPLWTTHEKVTTRVRPPDMPKQVRVRDRGSIFSRTHASNPSDVPKKARKRTQNASTKERRGKGGRYLAADEEGDAVGTLDLLGQELRAADSLLPKLPIQLRVFPYHVTRAALHDALWALDMTSAVTWVERPQDADVIMHQRPKPHEKHYDYQAFRDLAKKKRIPFVSVHEPTPQEVSAVLVPVMKLYTGEISIKQATQQRTRSGRMVPNKQIKLATR